MLFDRNSSFRFKDNFFIVTSENFNDLSDRFIGYTYGEDYLLINSCPNNELISPYSPGCFISIVNSTGSLTIRQDYFCSFGIYLFRKNKYWAISNSFYYLANSLSERFSLSPNLDYIDLFLFQSLVPNSITETAIAEISELSSGQYIIINKTTGSLEIAQENIEKYTIDPLSLDGISLLDNWYSKYRSIFSFLLNKQANIVVDLSGGKDSRAAIAPLISCDLNADTVEVHSATDGLHTHAEDIAIATQISEIYKFKLNTPLRIEKFGISSQEAINIMLYTKFLFHDEFYYPGFFTIPPLFRFGGNGGEGLRSYWRSTRDEFISEVFSRKPFPYLNSSTRARSLLLRTFSYLDKTYKEQIPAAQKLYNYTRIKNHFGRSQIGPFLCNQISIQPLLDPILYNFNYSDEGDILFAIIFARYMDKSKPIPFDGNRYIPDKIWMKIKNYDLSHIPMLFTRNSPKSEVNFHHHNTFESLAASSKKDNSRPLSIILDTFASDFLRKTIMSRYGVSSYKYAIDYFKNRSYFGERYITKFFQIYLLLDITSKTGINSVLLEHSHIPSLLMKNIIDDLSKARLDLILESSTKNSICVLECSDLNASFEYPSRFKSGESQGLEIHFNESPLHITFLATCNGHLKMTFRGIDKRDIYGKRLPILYDIVQANIYINNTISPKYTIADYIAISHDRPLVYYIKDIEENDKIILALEYKPTDYTREEINALLDDYSAQYDIESLLSKIRECNLASL